MPRQLGITTVLGYEREPILSAPTWPAPTAQTLTALIPFLDAEADDLTLVEDLDTTHSQVSHRTGQRVQPRVTVPARYDGIEWLWCAALGYQAKRIEGTLFPEQVAAGVYRHRFELAPQMGATPWTSNDGWVCSDGLTSGQQQIRRGTLVVASDLAATECRSTMVRQMSFSGQAGSAMQLVMDLVAYDLTESGVNDVSSMQALSALNVSRILFHDVQFLLGPYVAGSPPDPLDSGDAWNIGSCAVTVDHHLAANSRGPEHGLFIAEPWRTQRPTVSGSFTLPRHESLTLTSAMRSHTAWMLDATWTGPAIGATGHNYSLRVLVPTLTLREARIPHTVRVNPATYTWRATTPASTPDGFPTTVQNGPLVIEVISTQSVNPLLDS